MAFVPYEKFELFTRLTPDEVLERLIVYVDPDEKFNFFKPAETDYDYQGVILGNTFKIRRALAYKNPYNPQIKGIICADKNGGSIISIVMVMHTATYAFVGFMLTAFLIFTICLLVSDIRKQKFGPEISGGIAPIIIMYLITTGSFKYESKDSKRFLRKLLEVSEE